MAGALLGFQSDTVGFSAFGSACNDIAASCLVIVVTFIAK
jgi:hypothetical protein